MGSLLLLAVLAAIVFLLVKARPVGAEQARPGATPSALPAWLEGWPRQAIVFVASVALAFMVISAVLSILFGVTATLGAMVGVSGNLVMLALLGGLAFYIHRTKAAPKIRSFVAAKWAAITRQVQPPAAAPVENVAPAASPESADSAAPERPQTAPFEAPKTPRKFNPWLIAGLGAVAIAVVLYPRGKGQMSVDAQAMDEQMETAQQAAEPPPAVPKAPYLYRVANDTKMETRNGVVILKAGSCLRSVVGPNGEQVFIEDGKITVQVEAPNAADGMYGSGAVSGVQVGQVSQDKLINNGILTPNSPACIGAFVQPIASDAPETLGPSQAWRVVNRASLYEGFDVTKEPLHILADGSCVFSTGRVRGDMMEVRATGGGRTQTLWTRIGDYTKAPPAVTEATCEFKM